MCGNPRDYERRGDAEWLDTDDVDAPDESRMTCTPGRTARDALEATISRAFHIRVLKEIAHLSQNYPALPLILTENKISIPCAAPNGFPMSIETERGHYVVRLGEWCDEFALADEAVELLEAALRGEVRLRIDIDARGRCCAAERRLPNGEWIRLPRHEESIGHATAAGPIRSLFLRNAPVVPWTAPSD